MTDWLAQPMEVWELIASSVDHVRDWRALTLTCKRLSRLAFGESRTRILRKLVIATRVPVYRDHERWHLKGTRILHREDDLPALHLPYRQEWYKYGQRHRDNDKPAFIDHLDGAYHSWWHYGKCHRDNDMPAIVQSNGRRSYYRDGKRYKPDTINNN